MKDATMPSLNLAPSDGFKFSTRLFRFQWAAAWHAAARALMCVVLTALICPAALATPWSTQDYDLHSGDFNGDGYDDILYVAISPSGMSGIALSDGTTVNRPWQSWNAGYLGIAWSGHQYRAIVGDFNGDGRSDLLLQRGSPGNHYVLLADPNGRFSSINQTIAQSTFGLDWSSDKHWIIAGDFNGDQRDDVFLQAAGSGATSAVVLSSVGGSFGTVTQTWAEGAFGVRWARNNAYVYAGDLNGDGRADLLVQARPDIVLIDYEIPIPVPVHPPNYNAILYSQGGSTPFVDGFTTVVRWSRIYNGVDWSPLSANVVVGDATGDGIADIIVQSRSGLSPSWILAGALANGPHAGAPQQISALIGISGGTARLIVGSFGIGRIFVQSTSPGGESYLGSFSGATLSASIFDVNAAMPSSAIVRYTYDALGRLRETTTIGGVATGLQESYNYDAAGNRISVDVIGAP